MKKENWKTSPQWILEGDIKGCFDHISHEWMLENIPTDKRVMRQFLKCGYGLYGRAKYAFSIGCPSIASNLNIFSLLTLVWSLFGRGPFNSKA